MFRYIQLLITLLLINVSLIDAQSLVDITLDPTPSSGGQACFDIAVKSGSNKDINLAGQNYRLFYDAEKLDFIEDKTSYSFDPRAYGRVYIHNTETKGIGFLSLSLDGRKLTDQTIKLARGASWKQVMNVCFKETTETPYDLTWAHKTRTAKFASAEVALSEWVTAESQQILEVNELNDFTNTTDAKGITGDIILNVYPNPVIDYVNVEISGHDDDTHQLIIKDIIGREVVYDNIPGAQTSTYDLVNWPEGSYTIEILNAKSERVTATKVIKINP